MSWFDWKPPGREGVLRGVTRAAGWERSLSLSERFLRRTLVQEVEIVAAVGLLHLAHEAAHAPVPAPGPGGDVAAVPESRPQVLLLNIRHLDAHPSIRGGPVDLRQVPQLLPRRLRMGANLQLRELLQAVVRRPRILLLNLLRRIQRDLHHDHQLLHPHARVHILAAALFGDSQAPRVAVAAGHLIRGENRVASRRSCPRARRVC